MSCATASRAEHSEADAPALLDSIDDELFEDATVEPMRTDPTSYTGIIGNAIYTLTGRRKMCRPPHRLKG